MKIYIKIISAMVPLFFFVSCQEQKKELKWEVAKVKYSEITEEDNILMYATLPAVTGSSEEFLIVFDYKALMVIDSTLKENVGLSIVDYGIGNASLVGNKLFSVKHGFEGLKKAPLQVISNDLILMDTFGLNLSNFNLKNHSFFPSKVRNSLRVKIIGGLPGDITNIKKVTIEGIANRYDMEKNGVKLKGSTEYHQGSKELFMLLDKNHQLSGLSGAFAIDAATNEVIGAYSGRTMAISGKDTLTLARIILAK